MLYRLCTYIIFIGYCDLCVIHTLFYVEYFLLYLLLILFLVEVRFRRPVAKIVPFTVCDNKINNKLICSAQRVKHIIVGA